jgi:uncharacterized protein HemX
MKGKVALAISLGFAAGIILFVHERQRSQTARMRAGIIRELRLEAEQQQQQQRQQQQQGHSAVDSNPKH